MSRRTYITMLIQLVMLAIFAVVMTVWTIAVKGAVALMSEQFVGGFCAGLVFCTIIYFAATLLDKSKFTDR